MSAPYASALVTNPLLTVFSRRLAGKVCLVAELPFAKRSFEISAEAFVCLYQASRRCDAGELRNDLARALRLTQDEADSVIEQLQSTGLLISDDQLAQMPGIDMQKQWSARGWDSAYYYYSWLRDYPFVDYASSEAYEFDAGLMKEYARIAPPPDVYKDYVDARFVPLTKDHAGLAARTVAEVLASSDGESSADPSDATIGPLLYLVFGQTGSIRRRSFPPLILKTSPSGGGRHPVEAYLIAINVVGLEAGIYHYSVRRHGLEQITSGHFADQVLDVVYGMRDERESLGAIVVLTSVWQRAAWRYRDPRAYRPVLHDLGHVVQTFELVANGLKLAYRLHHGFDDDRLEELLGVDGYRESALFVGALLRSKHGV